MDSVLELWREAKKEISLTVNGTSMEPFLKSGDVVTIYLTQPEDLKRGDIIAFRENGQVIIHRLVKKQWNGHLWRYCQKGDNLAGWKWIPEGSIIGKVVCVKHSHRTAGMQDVPWRWLNALAGLWGTTWVIAVEWMQRGKRGLFGDRAVPLISKLRVMLFKPIHGIGIVPLHCISRVFFRGE